MRLNPLPREAMKKTPTTVPLIAPCPPAIDVPPTTTAAMTAKARLKSSLACAVRVRRALSEPASPIDIPARTKASAMTRSTGTPVSRAAY